MEKQDRAAGICKREMWTEQYNIILGGEKSQKWSNIPQVSEATCINLKIMDLPSHRLMQTAIWQKGFLQNSTYITIYVNNKEEPYL